MGRFEAKRACVNAVESGCVTQAARQRVLHEALVSQQVLQREARLGARLRCWMPRALANSGMHPAAATSSLCSRA